MTARTTEYRLRLHHPILQHFLDQPWPLVVQGLVLLSPKPPWAEVNGNSQHLTTRQKFGYFTFIFTTSDPPSSSIVL